MSEQTTEKAQLCEAIEAVFSYGPVRCARPAVGEAIDATWGTIHPVCEEHLPGWVECDHACDPDNPDARQPEARHFLDCPVWRALGVTTSPGQTGGAR